MSNLTPWQRRKLQSLCDERHPILSRLRLPNPRPSDRRLLRHIERQIDWYELKEYRPAHEHHRAQMRKIAKLYQQTRRLARLRGVELPTMKEAMKQQKDFSCST